MRAGILSLKACGLGLHVTANVVTVTASRHQLTATGTTLQRSLRTINGGYDGWLLMLQKDPTSLGDIILDEDPSGNLQLAGNFTLTSPRDKILLLRDNGTWAEVTRSNNA